MTENKYQLVEIFHSLQGEGERTGTPAVFVRFSHCNLSCSFCDTPYEEVNLELEENELLEKIASFPGKSVIFTGGEPTLALKPSLVDKLKKRGYFLAIETNGLLPVPPGIDWITVSPKTEFASIRQRSGSELKIIFGTQRNLAEWLTLDFQYFFLSPENGRNKLNEENNRRVAEYVKSHPEWRFTTQLHKALGIR
jgi:organic radical activating enzyme